MNTTFTTYAEKKAKQFLNLLQGYTKGIRFTAILILLLMGVTDAWAWCGNSFITVNGTWYTASDSYEQPAGYFHNKNLGALTTLTLGGQLQVYPSSNTAGYLYYKIDSGSEKSISLPKTGTSGNNSKHEGSGNVDLSGLAPGSHTIAVWFKHGSDYDSNNSANYKATFTIDPIVTFKANGGTGSDYTQTVKYNTATALTANKFTRTGYSFNEWKTAANSGTSYADKANVTFKANTTLHAQWTANQYTINYKDQGGSNFSGSHASGYPTKHTYGTATTLSTATKTGYTFGGWFTNSGCTGSAVTSLGATTYTANITLYAKWTENTYTVTINNDGHGTTTPSGAQSNVGQVTGLSIKATPAANYEFVNWTITSGSGSFGSTTSTSTTFKPTSAATIQANFSPIEYKITYSDLYDVTHDNPTTYTIEDTPITFTDPTSERTGYTFNGWSPASIAQGSTGDKTVSAQWTANTYTVHFDKNANEAKGSMDDQVFTYDEQKELTKNAFILDKYSFIGWATTKDGEKAYDDQSKVSNLTYTNGATVTLYAKWEPKATYTVTLDQTGAKTAGTTSVIATLGDPMPAIALPTPADGDAFMGYWDETNGRGTQYYDAAGKSVREWNQAKNTTLYAYFKTAEITSVTLDEDLFDSDEIENDGETSFVTVTSHEIAPKPAGTVVVCWTLCYNNGTPVGHDAIEEAGTVKFAIDGLSAGTYKIVASLRLNDCTGEELDRAEATFVVAGSYTVTIKYTCDGQEIAGRTTIEGHPSRQTAVTAPNIGGYNFVEWELGDGISTEDALTDETIDITANYEGYLTATYEKKKLIFLDISTLPNKAQWTAPHVYLYNDSYWDETNGAGASGSQCVAKDKMIRVPNTTDMWYFEYENFPEFAGYVAFTSSDKTGQNNFWDCEAIYRGDFSVGTPVFVPAQEQTANEKNKINGNSAKYYNKGHWTKYMGGTGYTLKIYNKKEAGRKELMSVPFTGSSLYLPFTAIVDLEGGQTFGYKIVRDNDKWYKNDANGTMTVDNHKNWPFVEDNSDGLACGIKTVAAGNHTFTLTLDATSGNFKVSVDYPVTVGDYRILYKDDTRTTYKPSDIKKAEELNPVTSFFIRPYKNPELIVQTAARVSNEGVTWYADNHIYFKPNANWKSDGARFAAWFNGDKWKDLNKNGDVYSCEIPSGATEVIFCRMDPKNATNNWNNNWNQTGHLALTTNNLYTLNEGEWGNKLYLKPNSNWLQKDGNQKDPRFAAYFFNSNSDYAWVSMGNPVDGVYSCDIPAKVYKNVIFCRMNGGNETNDWNYKYNQSSDLTVPTDGKTLYTVKDGTWDKGGGSWSVKEGSWSTINGSITDLSVQLKNKLAELDLEDIKETEGSVFNIHLSNNEGTLTIEKVAFYTGNFYIRVDAAAGKWYDYKTNPDNLMTYSAFSESDANSFGEKFSHYKTKWCPRGTNVKFVIANDYSLCISDTIARDLSKASGVGGEDYMTEGGDLYQEDGGSKDPVDDRFSANIRFMWNRKTNKISRAYLASSSNDSRQFLVLKGCQEIKDENGNNLSGNGDNHGEHRALLQDTQDWIYERTFMVRPGTRVKLYACYANTTVDPAKAQYFRGAYDSNQCGSTENSVQILGGSDKTKWEKIRVIYDFKTNRLIGAWVPSGEISETQTIAADVMIMRNHQEDATCITLAEGKSLTDVKTVYGTLRFNRWTLNNKDANSHQPLPVAQQQTIYERGLYFISFPFDVHLSDAFGLGTYGTHWVISTYNGKRRAERGYFEEDCVNEDCTNWDYIWDPTDFVMEANVGYLLSIDLELMKDDDTSFWPHNINYRELLFPSQVELDNITKKNYTMPELDPAEYECKINLNTTGKEPEKDRTVKDSYWRCIGVPSFADYDASLTDGNDATITWQPDGDNLPFLYEWNVTNNNLVVRSATNYRFRPTFAYLIQNGGAINWKLVSTKPNPIIARERSEAISNYEWKIALLRNGNTEDQTFVRISDNEAVTAAFDFNQDLAKEFNYGANIYTLVGYERLAANSLPMSDSTTIIPLGVSAQEVGDYTITMPEGVESIGITLVDTETGTRTNLSAGMEYTFTLNRGTYDSRLYLEISPIEKTPSDLEYVDEATRNQNVRKFIIDGKLYLQKDGMLYDAQGHIVR